jgi:integrase
LITDKAIGDWWVTKHTSAVHLYTHVKGTFSMAKVECDLASNPAAWEDNLEHLLPKHRHRVKHHPALHHEDLPRFMVALRGYEDRSFRKRGHTASAYALQFAILTGARADEVCKAQWKEIDRETWTWNVPADHLKNGKPCRRPITPSMIDVLRVMASRFPDHSPEDLIFPSVYGGKIRVGTLKTVVARLGWQIEITTHGFRSTLTDWGRARGYSMDLIDAQVAHVVGGKVRQAYARDDLLPQRRTMMAEYDNYASRPEPHAGNVIPMRKVSA